MPFIHLTYFDIFLFRNGEYPLISLARLEMYFAHIVATLRSIRTVPLRLGTTGQTIALTIVIYSRMISKTICLLKVAKSQEESAQTRSQVIVSVTGPVAVFSALRDHTYISSFATEEARHLQMEEAYPTYRLRQGCCPTTATAQIPRIVQRPLFEEARVPLTTR